VAAWRTGQHAVARESCGRASRAPQIAHLLAPAEVSASFARLLLLAPSACARMPGVCVSCAEPAAADVRACACAQDVRCQPAFVTVHKEDRDLNAVRFDVKVDAI
jgi:hypothetical protein